MSGLSLDLDGDKETRPDYECLGGALVVEIKSLEGDPSERLENVVAPAKERENWPKFFGEWSSQAVLKNLPEDEREALRKRLFDRLARAIVSHIKKANSQLTHFCKGRSGVHLRLLVLINEDFMEYDPNAVGFAVQRELRRTDARGLPKYAGIDAVLYLTERHATQAQGRVTFPILVVHGPTVAQNRVALELIRRIAERWAKWSSGMEALKTPADIEGFVPVTENPKRLRRQDVWARDYKHRPYMRKWSDEEVIGFWDFTSLMSLLAFHVDPPKRLPQESVTELMEKTTHLMQEFAHRGIALDRLKPTKERNEAAIGKVALGPAVQEWLRKQVEHMKQE